MRKSWMWMIVIAVFVGVLGSNADLTHARPPRSTGGISYASQPDEVALYLNDVVFVRDAVTLPNEEVRVLLPPGTFPDTLILTENGTRVRDYRIIPQTAEVYFSQAAYRYDLASARGAGGMSYALTWDPQSVDENAETRAVMLEYMMSGAHWTPTYDMTILSDESVALAFFAKIENNTLVFDATTVYLVAGRIDLSQQVSQADQITMNQYAVGYAAESSVALPTLGVGSVDLQHVYALGTLSAEPGDMVFTGLVDATLPARRLVVWNAADDQAAVVIFKVRNTTETPLTEGIVRTYKDGLFVGSDYIERTPVGSEGSVTVGSVPDVRVHRTASEEYHGGANDYYLHTVVLEVQNFGDKDRDLIILDRWEENAWQFEYSLEPERQQDNLLRWEVSLAAGETLTITYTFRTEY